MPDVLKYGLAVLQRTAMINRVRLMSSGEPGVCPVRTMYVDETFTKPDAGRIASLVEKSLPSLEDQA